MLLEGIELKKIYKKKSEKLFQRNLLTAVNNVSLSIPENSSIGVVGESGSGKSTLGELLGNLQKPEGGVVRYKGKDISSMSPSEYMEYRRNVQFIFQNPQGSMNPHYRIRDIMLEPMRTLLPNYDETSALKDVKAMMASIGLSEEYLDRYPNELSGGQCQRVAIGRALLLKPELIICDECVSALDVSVQAQILNLMKSLKREYGTSYLFISHDIAAVKYMSDEILVMYKGRAVEYGSAAEIIYNPQHNYTKRLIKYNLLKGA